MTLIAFFTLTDMKDGLLTPAKIEEWIAMLKNENLSATKNISEAARQWSTAASTLAATENKDSLDQFIKLDGLYLLDKWLRQASVTNEINDGSVEESIRLILGALMKLHVGGEICDTSGIRTTVNNLIGHKCAKVQEIAKTLFDSWSGVGNNTEIYQQNVVNEDQNCTEVKAIHGPLQENADEKSHLVVKPVGGILQHAGSSGGFQSGSLQDVQVPASSNMDEIPKTMTSKNEDGNEGDPQSLSILSSPPVKESSLDAQATVPVSSSQDPIVSSVVEASKVAPDMKVLANGPKEAETVIGGSVRSCEKILHLASPTTVPEPCISSSDPPAKALQSSGPSAVLCHVDAVDRNLPPMETTTTAAEEGPSVLALKPKCEVLNSGVLKQLSSKMEIKSTSQMDGYHSNALANSPINRSILRKQENRETSSKQGTDVVNHGKELTGKLTSKEQGGKTRSSTACVASNSIVNSELSNIADKSKTDMELDYMMDDALEVATQVAKEVRRQVVDYREPVCGSSSDNNSDGGGVFQPKSPDTISGELHSVTGRSGEMSTEQNLSAGSNPEDSHSTNSENMSEPRDFAADQVLSQVTADAQVPEGRIEKSMCDFDLNDDVSSEEVNHRITSNSRAVNFASPSRTATSDFTGEPPLGFVEEQGSKSCAAASEETVLAEDCNPSFKQRQDFRGIDLNVTEGDKSEAFDLVVEKQIPVASGLPSGKSSMDVSSRTVDRLELDLNLVGDCENMLSSDWRTEGRFTDCQLDSRPTLFTSAPSSSLKQASLKNIDLNEFDFGTSSFQRVSSHGGFQLEKDPIISIMGTRVAVSKNEFPPQTLSFLPNGQATGSSMMDMNLRGLSGAAVGAQSATAFAPSTSLMFDYGGLTMGHGVPPSPMYGAAASTPYVVDYRGAPATTELMGLMEAGPSSYSRPYLMSMGNQSSPLDGVGPSTRPVLDLNFGLTLAASATDCEYRESGGGLRHLLSTPGRGSLVEQQQQMRLSLQPLSSGLGLKRSEPDSGWDGLPVNFKHQSQWR